MASVASSFNDSMVLADMLHRTLVNEVVEEISAKVMPEVEKRIHDIALESVGHWSLKVKTEKIPEDFGSAVHISVAFVENVVNKIVQKNEIVIKEIK